jgi:hypothetical protein
LDGDIAFRAVMVDPRYQAPGDINMKALVFTISRGNFVIHKDFPRQLGGEMQLTTTFSPRLHYVGPVKYHGVFGTGGASAQK